MNRLALVISVSLAICLTMVAKLPAPLALAAKPPCQAGGGQITNSGTLTLQNCVVAGNSLANNGAGINNSGTLTLINVIVKNNTASDSSGGGIFNSGTLIATSVTIKGNKSTNSGGGGLYNSGTATLRGVTFRGNHAYGGDGGAIYNSGTVVLLGLKDHSAISTISANSATPSEGGGLGGGIYNLEGTVEMLDSVIMGNNAVEGAGVYTSAGTIEAQDAAIINNIASSSGGGFYVSGGSLCCGTLDAKNVYSANLTIAGNQSGFLGGGIYNSGGSVELMTSTIADNSASEAGGGIAVGNQQGTTELKGVLLARNTSSNCSLASSLVDDGRNLDTGTSCGFTASPAGTDLVNVGDSNVKLGTLTKLGKFLWAEALNTGSPAINALPKSACTKAVSKGAPLESDELDTPRPQGSACDIGAIEALPAP